MKTMKKTNLLTFGVMVLAGISMVLFTSSPTSGKELSQAEMGKIIGGAKHCSDVACNGWACIPNKTQCIANGTTGRECNGQTAECCTTNPGHWVTCATIYFQCNENCSTCPTSKPMVTNTFCSSY